MKNKEVKRGTFEIANMIKEKYVDENGEQVTLQKIATLRHRIITPKPKRLC